MKIDPTNGPIDPGHSKIKVKSNSINIELKKSETKFWSDIKDKKKKETTKEEGGDPLMSMMKDLYMDGDENMKRTIAESWTKA